ncbi:hypothetical protein CY34DRAFT_26971 [Suillus luteus UH-Slu-Lm8-n1]|uniref:CxC2-like cysteine cluster KDZ transposase-associated domain-containing protein n=1 Tax=Suillus luteus UH-Slu-Lm8-n1 TaxID=930992 RepID=A0A0D0AHU2_9AGAM|nr:hypothetical protein CY34DRAFT_26971 [Suillus luteus UH-Slu-Lm8-n1]
MFDYDNNTAEFENVLTGAHPIDVSHAGGKFQDLAREIYGDFWTLEMRTPNKRGRREDHRTRRDRIQRCVDAFNQQMPALVDAYLIWSLNYPNSGTWNIRVVDTYYAENISLTIESLDRFVASALVRQGIVPCSPISPSVGITVDALELYRVARLRSPHFSIQVYVKSICDLHGVNALVSAALNRNSSDWNLRNTCPCCTYELEGEPPMIFRLLYTMDGNNSLKRVCHRLMGADGDYTGPSIELPTTQQVGNDRYLACNYVNMWANAAEDEGVGDNENPCAGRWKNMDDEKTKKSWGVYDETGIFVAVCRHGFCLLIADIVQSGERAKYPLAVVAKLLNVFGADLGGGYNIGCQFKTTLDNSILGPQARALRHSCLVGAFHGHAHRRICQLDHLATYVKGLGLEDLETCDVFHCQQLISAYFQHNDEYDVYPKLGNFLYNNYRQALDILQNGQINLSEAMRDLDITDISIFNQWITNEKEYLQGLKSEPEHETLQMEYWQKLINLTASQGNLDTARSIWTSSTPSSASFCASDAAMTRKLEMTWRHALENFEKDLESKLEVAQRWVPDTPEWKDAGHLVAKRKYQCALDALEGLVVARIFELTKLNRSGTGYKLCKHIVKALQTRSSAIRSALDRYNTAALSLTPPRRTLKWDEVIEYVFLSDFDLLRDARQDISQYPWATPAARQATDLYFKMCRAKEEVLRLNNEIQRLVTYIHDEECYLHDCYTQLELSCPALAHQINLRRLVRSRANGYLLQRMADIAQLQEFSGSISIGESIKKSLGDSASIPHAQIPAGLNVMQDLSGSLSFGVASNSPDMQDELEDEEEDVAAIEEAAQALRDVLRVSADS